MKKIMPSLVIALVAAGCGGNTLPTRASEPAPSRPTPPRPLPLPVVPGAPEAAIAIARFTSGPGNDVQLVLRETGGRSGASFGSPTIVRANGDTDTGCPGVNRIPRGGRWSLDSMGYCAPVGDGSDALTVVILYQDDDGRVGTFTGVM